MPCYSCSAEYGLLKKEVGCENCGFSFCSRCCKKQTVSSEDGQSKKIAVCSNCFKQLTGESSSPTKGSPPLAHKKRMEAFKKQSYSVDSETHARLKSQWSNEKDKALAERLQRLKRDRIKNLLSEDEIAERLARLKGMDPAKYNAPPIQVFRPAEKRTSIEQASNLMQQITEEVNLDFRRVKPEDEIAARLAALRDEVPKKAESVNIQPSHSTEEMDIEDAYTNMQIESANQFNQAEKEIKILNTDKDYKELLSSLQKERELNTSDTEDEEKEADRLVKKLLETSIDDDMEDLDSLNDPETDKSGNLSKQSSEEFPWCVICTEDAKIRCFGCDQDLYCMRCFKECHDSLDIRDHKTCPFLPPKIPAL
ncbi:hypothetical protein JTE90_022009 [Oedothorax gibbosus]|uniref:FYVE-type domain-containing protein n=1 Tax=Oedothorax gibbosus TaxID=931172 RepID=A0AAV6V0V1_9ARAC|nr:hypothetical protein JTE90_022009 [Oedothorax gibbosus]